MITTTRRMEIEKAFDIKLAESSAMEESLILWRTMYEDRPMWCRDGVEPIGLPAGICEEIARMTTLDLDISVTGSPISKLLDDVTQKQLKHVKENVEFACALGGMAFKPYFSPTKGTIEVTTVMADQFYPTRFDSNKDIQGAVFVDQKIIGDQCFTRLERHELIGNMYGIENKCFVKSVRDITDAGYLGDECSLVSVEEWRDIKPVLVIHNVKKPLFAYFKVPMTNNVESSSPMGVSVFSRAVKRIKRCDIQWANIVWEYDATQAAIMADEDMFVTNRMGDLALEKRERRLFRTLEGFKDQIKEFAPAIRDKSLFDGLNQYLRKVEFQCSLAYGTISEVSEVEKTAEEVRTSKKKAITFVADMQKAFKSAFDDLLEAVKTMAVLYGLAPDGDYEVAYDFDESLAINRSESFKELMQLASAKMIKPELVTAWYFGISEEEAKKMLPDPFDETEENPPIEEE